MCDEHLKANHTCMCFYIVISIWTRNCLRCLLLLAELKGVRDRLIVGTLADSQNASFSSSLVRIRLVYAALAGIPLVKLLL